MCEMSLRDERAWESSFVVKLVRLQNKDYEIGENLIPSRSEKLLREIFSGGASELASETNRSVRSLIGRLF